jgi:hypothetical protein
MIVFNAEVFLLGYEDCSKNPCQDGTICLDTKEGFTCICAPWQEDCTRCKFILKKINFNDLLF